MKVFVIVSEVGNLGVISHPDQLAVELRCYFAEEDARAIAEGDTRHQWAGLRRGEEVYEGETWQTWQILTTCDEFPDEPYPYQRGHLEEWEVRGAPLGSPPILRGETESLVAGAGSLPEPGKPSMNLLHPERLGLFEGIRSIFRWS